MMKLPAQLTNHELAHMLLSMPEHPLIFKDEYGETGFGGPAALRIMEEPSRLFKCNCDVYRGSNYTRHAEDCAGHRNTMISVCAITLIHEPATHPKVTG